MLDAAYQAWLGRVTEQDDVVQAGPIEALAATLDRAEAPGDTLPPLWHWLCFLPRERQSTLGLDGHPQKGGFLPPVPLPRRMWAGGRLRFHQPLRVGDAVRRTSRIADISTKAGRSGALVFVRVVHEISGPAGLAIEEEDDIVYRDRPAAGEALAAPKPAPADAQFEHTVHPDPVLLFRYSALTFNGHRIHYDRPYTEREEGYPGLVVHGPLIATLLLETLQRAHPQARPVAFDFRALGPLFDTAPFQACGRLDGRVATLWARGPQGQLAMQATATLA